jgi:hypothetical protein
MQEAESTLFGVVDGIGSGAGVAVRGVFEPDPFIKITNL